eukprot:550135-Ditylum_brightwellii.AAC.1
MKSSGGKEKKAVLKIPMIFMIGAVMGAILLLWSDRQTVLLSWSLLYSTNITINFDSNFSRYDGISSDLQIYPKAYQNMKNEAKALQTKQRSDGNSGGSGGVVVVNNNNDNDSGDPALRAVEFQAHNRKSVYSLLLSPNDATDQNLGT